MSKLLMRRFLKLWQGIDTCIQLLGSLALHLSLCAPVSQFLRFLLSYWLLPSLVPSVAFHTPVGVTPTTYPLPARQMISKRTGNLLLPSFRNGYQPIHYYLTLELYLNLFGLNKVHGIADVKHDRLQGWIDLRMSPVFTEDVGSVAITWDVMKLDHP